MFGHSRELRTRAHERGHIEPERVLQHGFDRALERGAFLSRGDVEDDIPARDERLDAGEPFVLEQRAKRLHLHIAAADVDGPEKGDALHDDGRRFSNRQTGPSSGSITSDTRGNPHFSSTRGDAIAPGRVCAHTTRIRERGVDKCAGSPLNPPLPIRAFDSWWTTK